MVFRSGVVCVNDRSMMLCRSEAVCRSMLVCRSGVICRLGVVCRSNMCVTLRLKVRSCFNRVLFT